MMNRRSTQSGRFGSVWCFNLVGMVVLLGGLTAKLTGCVQYTSSNSGEGQKSSSAAAAPSEQLDQISTQIAAVDSKLTQLGQRIDRVEQTLASSRLETINPGGIDDGSPSVRPPTDQSSENTANNSTNASILVPDIPDVPLMTEVDGIKIPRERVKSDSLTLNGPIPLDVGNPAAVVSTKPVTGGRLSIRFNSQPESLNPITETSAVQTYIMEYVVEPLAWQNLETLEYEPFIARKWVIEDSVKLGPDYPGYERRVQIGDGEKSTAATLTYKNTADPKADKPPPVITVLTLDQAGQPQGNTWVGLLKTDADASQGPNLPLHFWSDENGVLELSGLDEGTYDVSVGVEVYGKVQAAADGSITLKPMTDENPLNEILDSRNVPALELSADDYQDIQLQTVFTYYLRDDVNWSDGKPFTSRDLEFAYSTINNTIVDGPSIRVYYQDLVECKGLTPTTVRMKYRQQYFNAFQFTYGLSMYTPPWHWFKERVKEKFDGAELTLARLTPEEEEVPGQADKQPDDRQCSRISVHGARFGKFFNLENAYNEAPLGTGPYVVDRWDRDTRIVLKRRDDYWNNEKAGYLDELEFRFITQAETAMQALKNGQLDFFWQVQPEQMHEQLEPAPDWFSKNYVKARWYSPGFSYFGWNSRRELFSDRRVRLAMSLLFDKQDFLEKKLYGDGVVVSGSQYYFGPGYDHRVPPLAYSPQTALDLLAEAGWIDSDGNGVLDKDGKDFEFDLLMSDGSTTAMNMATILQKNLKDVGIVMNVQKLEWASFLDKVQKKDYDATTLRWAQPLESDPFQIWHSSQAAEDLPSSNHVSFRNKLADRLIESIRLTVDESARLKMHHAFHRLLDAEQPYMFLMCRKDLGAYHQKFRGVKWYRLRPGFNLREWYIPKDLQ